MHNQEPQSSRSRKPKKRVVDVLVLSDVHLGTYGCHAKELHRYLKSIKPKTVVLNGDIIDMWQFNKRYFPKSHLQVVKKIVSWISKGVKVHYLTGNHDEMLRRFAGLKIGPLIVDNKLVLDLNGRKTWFFHGDVFDVTMQHSRWLTRLGAYGYDLLILLNAVSNWVTVKLGREKFSFSKRIKDSVKSAVAFINNFETVCTETATAQGYNTVVCGHIHQPVMKSVRVGNASVLYLNSGDWVENLTALEYHDGQWTLYRYRDDQTLHVHETDVEHEEMTELNDAEIFERMLRDFNLNTSQL